MPYITNMKKDIFTDKSKRRVNHMCPFTMKNIIYLVGGKF